MSKRLYLLSRPRFRGYILGPILIAWIAGLSYQYDSLGAIQQGLASMYTSEGLIAATIILVSWGTYGANILIYGVNDLADKEIDDLNPKKGSYEIRLNQHKAKQSMLIRHIIIVSIFLIIALGYTFLQANITNLVTYSLIMFTFLFFGLFYSLKPIRAKTIPFVDGIFNVLYIVPSVLGRLLSGADITNYSRIAFGAGWLFVIALHGYSAIPDIQADSDAGIATVATILQKKGTLIYCLLLRIAAFGLLRYHLGARSLIGMISYILVIIASRTGTTFQIYKQLPLLNMLLGAIYFRVILLT